MSGRGFCVKIELELHAITCPGVWLCPNGKVVLQINTLDACIESSQVRPVFPLLFHNKFVLQKIFTGISTLIDLQHRLEKECFYSKLVQWPTSSSRGITLSTFETNLGDILYPAPCFKNLISGVDVDLLMESTKSFPGIIAPKIEISTRTIVEEVINVPGVATTRAHIINPKVLNSKNSSCSHRKRPKAGITRQRRVCHSRGKVLCQSRHQEQNSKNDKNTSISYDGIESQCYHKEYNNSKYICSKSSIHKSCDNLIACSNNCHVINECPVCSKYKYYFRRNRSNSNDDMFGKCNSKIKSTALKSKDYEGISDTAALYKLNGCICRRNSVPSLQDEPISMSESKAEDLGKEKDKLYRNYNNYDSCNERLQGNQDQRFYKNLEKFYKRMYKHAKLRAQEANCA